MPILHNDQRLIERERQRRDNAFWEAVVEHDCFGQPKDEAVRLAAQRTGVPLDVLAIDFERNFWR